MSRAVDTSTERCCLQLGIDGATAFGKPLASQDHFSISEELAKPDGALVDLTSTLVRHVFAEGNGR